MLMILPEPWSVKMAPAAWARTAGAVTLVASTSSQACQSWSANGVAGAMPALLMMMSRRPKRLSASWGRAATCSRSRRSTATVAMRSGWARASSSSASVLRAAASTLTPSAASAVAAARPSPRLAPVTIATFAASPRSMVALLTRWAYLV